jgi:L-threonate 2-dehydrogenase
MPNQIRRVGVVGLGAMGMGVAQLLLRAGFEVHACDVRPEAVAKIIEAGAHGGSGKNLGQVACLARADRPG